MTIQRLLDFWDDQVFALLGLAARLRNSVRYRAAGDDPNSRSTKHVVYVHFDSNGGVADFVFHQLREFAAVGFRTTFVSNSPDLKLSEPNELSALCREIIHRKNVGYDFAAYRDGIRSVPGLDQATCLILANDSVYGPLFPLTELLERCDPNILDVWGATDSNEITYHVQSYFLLFYKKALQSRAFHRFWTWYPDVGNRKWVIRYGEIGLSRCLIAAGLRIGAVFRCADAGLRLSRKITAVKTLSQTPQTEHFFHFVQRAAQPSMLNPTQMFWEEMVIYERFPFLKRDLIRDNILNVPFVIPWQTVVQDHTTYDRSLIERHLPKKS